MDRLYRKKSKWLKWPQSQKLQGLPQRINSVSKAELVPAGKNPLSGCYAKTQFCHQPTASHTHFCWFGWSLVQTVCSCLPPWECPTPKSILPNLGASPPNLGAAAMASLWQPVCALFGLIVVTTHFGCHNNPETQMTGYIVTHQRHAPTSLNWLLSQKGRGAPKMTLSHICHWLHSWWWNATYIKTVAPGGCQQQNSLPMCCYLQLCT